MISCDGDRLEISGDFLDVAAHVGCIIMGTLSEKHPDFVNDTIYRALIASMCAAGFEAADKEFLYKDKTFNSGVDEVINSLKALRELAEKIIEG